MSFQYSKEPAVDWWETTSVKQLETLIDNWRTLHVWDRIPETTKVKIDRHWRRLKARELIAGRR